MPVQVVDHEGVAVGSPAALEVRMFRGEIRMIMRDGIGIGRRPEDERERGAERRKRAEGQQRRRHSRRCRAIRRADR